MSRLGVHVLQGFDDDWIGLLKEQLDPSIDLTHGDALPDDPTYHVLVAGRPTREFIEASSNMKAVIIPWAGLPVQTRELLLNYPELGVFNLHHNASATAETAMALMLAAAKEIVPLDRKLRKNDWGSRGGMTNAISLSEKTAVILGYGEIGKRVGAACRGLGMETVGITRQGGATSKAVTIDSVASLDHWLPGANVLFITVPLTDETSGLIDRARLAALPDNAIVVNMARGPVVNEQALFDELSTGRIRAGIDVWYNYPTGKDEMRNTQPSAFPFHELENAVMTPHIGGNALDIEPQRIKELAALLNTAVRGETMPNRVDPGQGY